MFALATIFAGLVTPIATSLPAYAAEPEPADNWTFAVRPYLWLPGINGTLKYDIPSNGGGGANVDFESYILENLSFALMLSAEARKEDWSILTDIVYLDVESGDSRVKSASFTGPGGRVDVSTQADVDTTTNLSGFLWELAGAYSLASGGKSSLDVLAGFRYLTIKAKTDWQLSGLVTGPGPGQLFPRSGGVSQREDLWDGIVGVRGHIRTWQREVGHTLLPRRGHGLLGADVAGDGGDRVPVRLGRPAAVVPLPVLRHEERQDAGGGELRRFRPRREFPLLTGRNLS